MPKKRVDDKLVCMIVEDMQPYRVVEDKGFRDFVATVDPRYQLPSRPTVVRKFEDLYLNTDDVLVDYVSGVHGGASHSFYL